METNFLAIAVAALFPLAVGYVWYHPKGFGTVWKRVAGLSTEDLQKRNKVKNSLLTLLLSFMIGIMLQYLVIHQLGAMSLTLGDRGVLPSYEVFMDDYGMAFRTIKHGALHGLLSGVFLALPIIAINGLFECRSAKYIFINAGYWTVSLTLMGAVICFWV